MNKINNLLSQQASLKNQTIELDKQIIKSIFEDFPQIKTLRYQIDHEGDDQGGTYTNFSFDSINSESLNIHNWEDEELDDDEKESLLKLNINISEAILIKEALESLSEVESYSHKVIKREKFA